ncbi:unnamed protein product [Meloidogyne enterolobii]|uniref:Uncharacterized protein n=1 Tax=Meloidogyne enterolobii TaxID=390850 RepID=A0ACB0YU38_MELEN
MPICFFPLITTDFLNFKTRVTVYSTHAPAGTSTRNIAHWAQMHHSGLMQKFNYGSKRANQKHYGQNTPPLYNLTNIANIPIYLYYSEADWLATKKDVEVLKNIER